MIEGVVISLVAKVLQGVITDLLRERKKEAQKKDIETAVSALLRDRYVLTPGQLDHAVNFAMSEAVEIIRRDPDLVMDRRQQRIKLSPEVAKSNTPDLREEILTSRLQNLQEIVTARRSDLGLPITETEPRRQQPRREPPLQEPPPGDQQPLAGIQWTAPDGSLEREFWQSEFDAMKKRVAQKRTGGSGNGDDAGRR